MLKRVNERASSSTDTAHAQVCGRALELGMTPESRPLSANCLPLPVVCPHPPSIILLKCKRIGSTQQAEDDKGVYFQP
jgi:hypothetical protein